MAAPPTKIMIIRHAEKPPNSQTPQGRGTFSLTGKAAQESPSSSKDGRGQER